VRPEEGSPIWQKLTQPPKAFTDTENAKRFRDYAAEARQLADLAETDARRTTLAQIADNYECVAQNLEGIANVQVSPRE